jgi:glucose/arabinose dehydrogenase
LLALLVPPLVIACGGSGTGTPSEDADVDAADAAAVADTAVSDIAGDAVAEGDVDADIPAEPLEPLAVECQEILTGLGPEGATALDVTVVAAGLAIPWSLDWLPDGSMLLTERAGTLRRVTAAGVLLEEPLANVPITTGGEGGLLGLAVSPTFASDNAIFLYYTSNESGTVHNRVERWLVSEDLGSASFGEVIVNDIPARQFHNGGRLRFGPDGMLYIGTGDATTPAFSQDPENLAGKLLRVAPDGAIPDDNPWGTAAWLIGLRNLQAFDWRADGRIVLADHGPSGLPAEDGRTGYDEFSVAEPGDNLGWPDVYRCESAGELLAPSMTWQDALPPGGAAVVPATAIPAWEGDVLVGVLGFGDDVGHLHRFVTTDDGNVSLSEVYLRGEYGRLRDVVVGPDGALYVTTSNCDGRATCDGDGDLVLRVTGP